MYFKEKIKGKIVLMGDLIYKLLKGYYKDKFFLYGKIYVVNFIDMVYEDVECIIDVIEFVKNYKDDLWIIGGKVIYNLILFYVDYLLIIYVLDIYKGNVYFNYFDLFSYKLVDKKLVFSLIFVIYKKEIWYYVYNFIFNWLGNFFNFYVYLCIWWLLYYILGIIWLFSRFYINYNWCFNLYLCVVKIIIYELI